MFIWDKELNKYREATQEDIEAMYDDVDEAEYWVSLPYDEAVNAKIRERYSESQEFAILRQKDENPQEYTEYYAYCEECKAFMKSRKAVSKQ